MEDINDQLDNGFEIDDDVVKQIITDQVRI